MCILKKIRALAQKLEIKDPKQSNKRKGLGSYEERQAHAKYVSRFEEHYHQIF